MWSKEFLKNKHDIG